MKRGAKFLLLTALAAPLFLTGCYTQVGIPQSERAAYERGYEEGYEDAYYDDKYYDDKYDDAHYDDDQYDSGYYDDDGTVINNYYGYSPYRRYYSYYHPS
ncbi:MAG: hypothetical protein GF419_00120, partial [Ignavibacteriales bacterium]|nr:hypothetical protein [Ignavibacteriales bacterium]